MFPLESFLEWDFPLLLGYAEIHYHLRFLYPRYYRKEPEIIADVPIRCIKDITPKLPLLIIVKDAHLFPIYMQEIEVEVRGNRTKYFTFPIQQKINQKYYSQILEIDLEDFEIEQNFQIQVEMKCKIGNKDKIVINDNYPDLKKQPFNCYYAGKKLPFPENWHPGEPHYHSIHTSDQVEFGTDISSTKIIAKAMGLSWFFVTDHSYDLDDCQDNCTQNDPDLPIWHEMKKNCRSNDELDFRVIPGEEISIGNSEGKNVHLLAINNPEFIEGHGDSAERWFHNKPQHSISEIKTKHTNENLFIAAHPFEKIPFLQKLTLRRGSWQIKDYKAGGINFLQVINSAIPSDVYASIEKWKTLLLQGYKYCIIAGNDAHGNFNVMRQIKSPFWKLFSSDKQTFGKFFTAFQYQKNDPIAGLKAGNVIVSNGPFLNFSLQQETKTFPVGSTCKPGKYNLIINFKTTPEFGEFIHIKLIVGDFISKEEMELTNPDIAEILNLKVGYIRMCLTTSNGEMAFTNPIWVE
jgi:hypothetical protein